tara:strand:+ start:246 stop:368 length:123 start_codon:yes stop_codon:yes gene_type:complete
MKIRDLVLCGFLALSLSSFAQEATSVIEKKTTYEVKVVLP